jgi:hypothetical protein
MVTSYRFLGSDIHYPTHISAKEAMEEIYDEGEDVPIEEVSREPDFVFSDVGERVWL